MRRPFHPLQVILHSTFLFLHVATRLPSTVVATFGSIRSEGTLSDFPQENPLPRDRELNVFDHDQRRFELKQNQQNMPFTMVFFSDLENRYRGHPPERCRYVLEYISNLGQEAIYFDDDYSDFLIEPRFVLHGGDNNHMLGCDGDRSPLTCRPIGMEWDQVWSTTFDANLPLISGYGNHDWQTAAGTGNEDMWGSADTPRTAVTDTINQRAQDLVARTYRETAALEPVDFTYQEFPPSGDIGQSMYRSVFRGVQIASFNCAANWESYDDEGIYLADEQFEALAASLDRNMPTIFFEHYPIQNLPPSVQAKVTNLIHEFPDAVFMAGHHHRPSQRTFERENVNQHSFKQFVAPYPHTWSNLQPGLYALLVSPVLGILQVKQLEIPGLEDGTPCQLGGTCGQCNSGFEYWYREREHRCGQEPCFESNRSCVRFLSCYQCCSDEITRCRFGLFCRCQ